MSKNKEDKIAGFNKRSKAIVYTAPDCSDCNDVRNYLVANDIEFVEKDIIRDKSAAIEMMRKSRQKGVPQIVIDDKFVVGYDRSELDNLMAL